LERLVLESRESLFNAILHERVEGAESMTEVKVDGPFDGDCVQGHEGGCETLERLAAVHLTLKLSTTKLKMMGQV
jgi:hypothetical protein